STTARRRRSPRRSQARTPNVIVEILSPSTAHVDRGEKKQIYQDVFRTPEYFLFDPETAVLEGFRLTGGRYAAIAPNPHGLLESVQLSLAFGVHGGQLRFFELGGKLIQTPDEEAVDAAARAEAEAQRADAADERADAEAQRAERLREKLRSLGVDPEA